MPMDQQAVLTLAGAIILLLLGAIAWFLQGVAKDIKEAVRTINIHTAELAVINSRMTRLELETAQLREAKHDLSSQFQALLLRWRSGESP